MADIRKLAVLLPHWIEHAHEHAQSYREWANTARKAGRELVAEQLEQAAVLADRSADALATILREVAG